MKYINFILLYFLVSCAQQTPLTGGQKDVTPPQLDSLRTHPSSLATSFNEKEVELVFNENILDETSSFEKMKENSTEVL